MAKAKVQKGNPLARTGYIVSDAVLAGLARDYSAGIDRVLAVRGNYLRILVAHTKREVGKKRPTTEEVLDTIKRVHEHHYAVVASAIITPEIADSEDLPADQRKWRALERNRKLGFARSAKSTLTTAVKNGVRIVSLDPAEVTKDGLRRAWTSPTVAPASVEEKIDRTEAQLESLVKELIAEDKDAAERVVAKLHAKLAELMPPPPVARKARRVGEIVMHPH